MLNLLKSDLYRLVRGKMLWVLLVLMTVGVTLSVAMLWFVSTDTFMEMAQQNVSSSSQSGASATADEDAPDTMVYVTYVPDGSVAEPVDTTTVPGLSHVAGNIVLGGGFAMLLCGLFTAIFLSSDVSTGFSKSILAARRSRMAYYLEKLLVVALVAFAFVVVGVIACAISTTVAGFTFTDPESIGSLLAWMALTWLITYAYACVVALVTWISGNVAAGAVTAVCTTMVEGVVQSALGALFPGSPVAGAIVDWLPVTSAGLLGSGSDLLTAAATTGEVFTPLAHVLITGIVCIGVVGGASLAIVRTRDV